jgi:hypothetical protein
MRGQDQLLYILRLPVLLTVLQTELCLMQLAFVGRGNDNNTTHFWGLFEEGFSRPSAFYSLAPPEKMTNECHI